MVWKRFPVRMLNTLIDKISENRAERRKEEEKANEEFSAHMRKYCYLDSLQFALGMIVDSNYITINNDKKHGYSIIIDGKNLIPEPKTEYIRPNITINLEGRTIDNITLTFTDQYIGNPAQIFNLRTLDDYRHARNTIYYYITKGQGNWAIKKERA